MREKNISNFIPNKRLHKYTLLVPLLEEQNKNDRNGNVPKFIHPTKTDDQNRLVDGNFPPSHIFVDALDVSYYETLILPIIEAPQKTPSLDAQDTGIESYKSIIVRLIKSSGIYALSSLASPLISLLLSPFLTRHLSHTDYGALAILLTFISLLAGITQLGLPTASVRAYTHEYEDKHDRLDVISTSFTLLVLSSLFFIIIGVIAEPLLTVTLLNGPLFSNAVKISIVVVFIQNLTVPGLSWLRAEGRPTFYSILSISNLIVSALATIIFVGKLNMGIDGAILATGTGYAVVAICTLPIILRRAGLRLRLNIAKSMLAFGFPHLMNFVSGWILQLLDRYLLGLLGSLSQTANYAVAYSIGGAMSAIVVSPFSLAWWVIMYKIAKRDDAPHVFRLIFRCFSLVLLFAAFGFATFGNILLDLFFPPSYHSAAPVIPIIALSMVFNGINVLLTLGVSLKRKIGITTVSLASSAIINCILNFAFIPSYGAMGAALATLLAYIALASISGIINQRIYPVPLEIGQFIIALVVGMILYIGSNFLTQKLPIPIGLSIHIGCIVLYGLCLIGLGILQNKFQKNIITQSEGDHIS